MAPLPVLADNHANHSRSELRQVMREANTADQCRLLAAWFREEEVAWRGKAEAEEKDYERYKALVRTKVPTRADNARSWRDYYSNKAGHMAELAARYETELARLDPSYRPVTAAVSTAGAPATTGTRAASPSVDMQPGLPLEQ
jgi:hypothetical protein